MLIVIDTNILISSLWTPSGNASSVISSVITGKLTPCYDARIMEEYNDVLKRPAFKFETWQTNALIDYITDVGMSVTPDPLPHSGVRHEEDLPFYEVAKYCNAILITGNLKDFPTDPLVCRLSDFCEKYL